MTQNTELNLLTGACEQVSAGHLHWGSDQSLCSHGTGAKMERITVLHRYQPIKFPQHNKSSSQTSRIGGKGGQNSGKVIWCLSLFTYFLTFKNIILRTDLLQGLNFFTSGIACYLKC